MRKSLECLAACLAAVALTPVAAHAQDEDRAAELSEKLNDPMTQYAVAGMISAMSKAVLDMRIEPLVKAMEEMGAPAPDLPPDATVGDLTGVDQAELREEIVDKVPKAMRAMGSMAGSAEKMLPELEKMARRMREAAPRF